jgi:hypothetical protein
MAAISMTITAAAASTADDGISTDIAIETSVLKYRLRPLRRFHSQTIRQPR